MERPPAYFDTSVIAKHYVVEPAMAAARTLLVRHRIVSSRLASLELRALLRRRLAAREIAESDYERVLNRVTDDRARWDLVDVDDVVLRRAEQLVIRSPLRILDAIHIASALNVRDAAGLPLPFVTSDARQRAAAQTAGLDVVWVA